MTVTPIDESPYSKSASYIGTSVHPLPCYDALKAAERGLMRHAGVRLHTKMSNDEMMSDASSNDGDVDSSSSSSESDEGASPTDSEQRFGLFASGSPLPPSSSASTSTHAHRYPYTFLHDMPSPATPPPQILSSTLSIYQDPSTPMYDPWLVRVVLDLFDVRGFDWMSIAEPIERVWGVRTGSAEVLEILVGNGRVGGRRWWD